MSATSIGPADVGDARALLAAASLPTADLDSGTHADFLAVRDAAGHVVGVIAVEPHGSDGLLRSLAVDPAHRASGLGSQLVHALEVHARAAGISTLYLLTNTAEAFFAKRGYARADRDTAPAAIRATPEFSGLCPSSAAFMAKTV